MDKNLEEANQLKAERTIKALTRNNIEAVYVKDSAEALEEVKRRIQEGAVTASGGSSTLSECGVMAFLKEKTSYIDRNDPSLTPAEKRKAELASFAAEFYLLSANAITEHGEIYEVDGNGNRVAALAYGPEKVIIIAGINKVVPNLRAAVERVKHNAAPANCIRLNLGSFCASHGVCVQDTFDEANLMCRANCGENSICADTLILSRQRKPGRITVILVGEELGY